jgi:NADH dehydrogenase (ubiquinone) 1 beta subcomplex subunit 10
MGKQFYGEAANYPGAPKNFDPANPLADKVAAIQQREHIVREKLIKVETAKVRSPTHPPQHSFMPLCFSLT